MVLSNIKGFDRAELDFSPSGASHQGWSVVTGDNGSGKTALLRAIALAILGPEQSRVLVQDDLSGWVSDGHDLGTISVEIKPAHEWDRTQKGGFPTRSTLWAEVEISADGAGGWRVRPTDVYRKKKKGALNGPWAQTTTGWCALGYGPFRRMYGSSSDASRLTALAGRIPRFATLFKEDATLAECEEWARELQYRSLEGSDDAELALKSLLDLIGTDFLRNGVTVDEVNSEGIWLRDGADRRMKLSAMSDGYRSALAMLMDIYRHMLDVYGSQSLVETDDEGRRYVNAPGVVLIDEVDAHLHPDWQREIGFWLKQHFPLVQFIVTTHSPLVCPAADGGRIYHLPQPGSSESPFMLFPEDYENVIAGKPDQILVSPAFGLPHTRSPRAVRARVDHAKLVSKKLSPDGITAEEEAELEQLAFFVRD